LFGCDDAITSSNCELPIPLLGNPQQNIVHVLLLQNFQTNKTTFIVFKMIFLKTLTLNLKEMIFSQLSSIPSLKLSQL
jgi:hypothetical protein